MGGGVITVRGVCVVGGVNNREGRGVCVGNNPEVVTGGGGGNGGSV